MRHIYKSLCIGKYHTLYARGQVYVFARILGDEVLIIGVNGDTNFQEVQISLIEKAKSVFKIKSSQVVYGEGTLKWNDSNIILNLPSRSGLIVAT